MMMYANDNNEQLPALNTGYWPGVTAIWWFNILDAGNYITGVARTNNVWRCPAVMPGDIDPGVVSYFKSPCEGYGPNEGNSATQGIIRYGQYSDGYHPLAPLGSMKLTSLQRNSQLWLIGDVGVPKNKTEETRDKLPSAYNTEITTKQPDPTVGWAASPYKQPAARHSGRAVMSFCDGHVDNWRWVDLRADRDDIFAVSSY
jgi:prepilin-type processing-associated H-X9-DG protein